MKIKILHVIAALFLVGGALVCNVANAQREGLSPNELDPEHLEYNANEDKPLLIDHEAKSKLLNRDSISLHSRSAASGTKVRSSDPNKSVSSHEDDEDALSFNFLYYIIQKFKISDLVDE